MYGSFGDLLAEVQRVKRHRRSTRVVVVGGDEARDGARSLVSTGIDAMKRRWRRCRFAAAWTNRKLSAQETKVPDEKDAARQAARHGDVHGVESTDARSALELLSLLEEAAIRLRRGLARTCGAHPCDGKWLQSATDMVGVTRELVRKLTYRLVVADFEITYIIGVTEVFVYHFAMNSQEEAAMAQQPSAKPIPTALIGPDTLIRQGLQRILHGTQYRTTHVAEMLDMSRRDLAVDLVSFTLWSDRARLLADIRRVKVRGRNARVVVMGENNRTEDIRQLRNAGADAYLPGNSTPAAVLAALDAVMRRESVATRSVRPGWPSEAKVPVPSNDSRGAIDSKEVAGEWKDKNLSSQETKILLCLMKGRSNKDIAHTFDIVEHTVKQHVKAILRKLHVANRTQAALWAHSHHAVLLETQRGSTSGEKVLLELLARTSARLVLGEAVMSEQLAAVESAELKAGRSTQQLLTILEDSLKVIAAGCDDLRRDLQKS